ncbi:response regulator transcription factor [Vibrio sp. S4M6]|uniref:response regulator transcription factor n=1 Tax=Vibrio sinus TaxID=2946865 RepID=UPI00202A02EF|nr:response regulator transcription factor [Vibrio sinus]MCL9781237.1 response regulator transcription factor [Vibrio sinus]
MLGTVLLIEDDLSLSEVVVDYLECYNIKVIPHHRGDTAMEKIEEVKPDIVILDIMLPGKNGLDICRDIYNQFIGEIYILMLTACNQGADEVVSLELGADDYLQKPIEPRVLLARIRSLLRRKSLSITKKSNITFSFDGFYINSVSRVVQINEVEVPMTTSEFDLLWLLVRNHGKVLSRDFILNEIRGGLGSECITDRFIDAKIYRLRKIIDHDSGESRIKTVRNKGYLFVGRKDSEN